MASGFLVYHSYLPQALTCSSDNCNPPSPRAHDAAFVYFALKEAFLRDRHAPSANQKYQEFERLYLDQKQALLAEADPPSLSVRPVYRT